MSHAILRFTRGRLLGPGCCLVLMGLSACNMILDNSTATRAEEGLTDGGTSGSVPESGAVPLPDGAVEPAADAGPDGASSASCPCGDIEGYCSGCAPTVVVSGDTGPTGITHLAVTSESLLYLRQAGAAGVRFGTWPFDDAGVPQASGSEAQAAVRGLATPIPALGEPQTNVYYELDSDTRTVRQQPGGSTYESVGAQLYPASGGVLVVGTQLTHLGVTASPTRLLASLFPDANGVRTLWVASNESTVFGLAPAATTSGPFVLHAQGYRQAGAGERSRSLGGLAEVGSIAANAERVFFTPCIDSRICSVPAGGDEGQVTAVFSSTSKVDRIFVDGAVLYFSVSAGTAAGTFRCNVAHCQADFVDGGLMRAMALGSSDLFMALSNGTLLRIPRTPLRAD